MDHSRALSLVAHTFPGSRILPAMKPNPSGKLAACSGCGGSTILVDHRDVPWHQRCKRLSLGIAP